MPQRLAAVCAMIVFAFCLITGLRADNSFATTVGRALVAMGGTFVVGLVLGWAAQNMLEENVHAAQQNLKNQSSTGVDDR